MAVFGPEMVKVSGSLGQTFILLGKMVYVGGGIIDVVIVFEVAVFVVMQYLFEVSITETNSPPFTELNV